LRPGRKNGGLKSKHAMKSRKDRISAADCRSMDEIRAAIDEIDREMVDLLAERAGYIDRAWRLKQPISEEALVQWRVEDVLEKVKARAAERGVSPELTEGLWRQMMDWFIQYESRHLEKHRKG